MFLSHFQILRVFICPSLGVFVAKPESTNGSLLVWVGGLDSWNLLMKGSVT